MTGGPRATDAVFVELTVAKSHLRNARVLAEQQGDPPRVLARITLALDMVQDALDDRSRS